MDVSILKDKLLMTMDSIDKDKLSLMDLRLYADILKTVSEIQTKSYAETMAEMMNGFHVSTPQTRFVGEMKEGE